VNRSFDALVIGAGIIGCAAAEALTHAGARVRLIDRHAVGEGATQASAGILAPYIEGRHDAVLSALGARSLSMFAPLFQRLAGREPEPMLVRCGTFEVAFNDDEAADLQTRAAALRSEGVDATFASGADARRLEPSLADDCVAGLFVPSHGFTRASELTQALWRACQARGGVLTQDVVDAIRPGPAGTVVVVGRRETLSAPAVVLAAGCWAGQIHIAGAAPLPVQPVRGQILQLMWPLPPLAHVLWSSRCYAVPWTDGTMLAGATLEDVGFDDRATVAGVRDLLDGLCEMLPRAWQAGFSRVRVGLRPRTPDARPVIGRSALIEGLVYAAGHYRNGVLLAPLTGELVAKAVAGEDDPAFQVTNPRRFGEL
jgi:glycine oxidase